MIEILFLGFLLGMRHAFESDHVAAVASLVTRSPSLRESLHLGSMWGLGHTLTLLILGSAVMLLDHMIPERMALLLEFAVGFMLVLLGIDVVRRFMRERVHLHAHRHADGTIHFHAHAHENVAAHSALTHDRQAHDRDHDRTHNHRHPAGFPLRALLVGIMHGMAGSAAMIVLTLQTVHSFGTGLLYISLFGLGSIGGMAAMSVAIMLPLKHSARRYASLNGYLQLAIGCTTLILGASMMLQIARGNLLL